MTFLLRNQILVWVSFLSPPPFSHRLSLLSFSFSLVCVFSWILEKEVRRTLTLESYCVLYSFSGLPSSFIFTDVVSLSEKTSLVHSLLCFDLQVLLLIISCSWENLLCLKLKGWEDEEGCVDEKKKENWEEVSVIFMKHIFLTVLWISFGILAYDWSERLAFHFDSKSLSVVFIVKALIHTVALGSHLLLESDSQTPIQWFMLCSFSSSEILSLKKETDSEWR